MMFDVNINCILCIHMTERGGGWGGGGLGVPIKMTSESVWTLTRYLDLHGLIHRDV